MRDEKLPIGWDRKRIKEIVKYRKGKKPTILEDEEFENSVPYLDIKALELGEIRRYADYESSNLLDANSIAIVWDGARSGWVSKGKYGAIGSTIAALTPILVNVDYTYHFLRSQFEKLNNNTRGTGIPHVNPDVLWNIQIPIAPISEQKRIVDRLDAIFGHLDVLREKLERIPELLKNFRQQVLTQAVTGELTREWREGKDLDNAFYKLIESFNNEKKKPIKARGQKGIDDKLALFKLPKGWKWIPHLKLVKDGGNAISAGPFGTIFKAKDFRDTGVPIIFLRHVKKEGFNQRKPNFMDERVWKELHQEYSISGGELLVTKLGDPPGEATIYPKGIGVAMITPDVMKSDLNEDFALTLYVSYFFNSSICKEFIASISFGMTRLRIDLTMFKSFPIPLPTIEEQIEIVQRVEELFSLADKIESQYQSLKAKIDQMPQAILVKAFRGELVEQEVKEYVREAGEVLMAAESETRIYPDL